MTVLVCRDAAGVNKAACVYQRVIGPDDKVDEG